MRRQTRITILADNRAATAGLDAEHGFAALVEAGTRRILFDTGQGKTLAGNAAALGCRLDGLDAIVLSHGHYDHTGGLAHVLPLNPRASIFLHPAAVQPKYTRSRIHGSPGEDPSPPPHRFIGMPPESAAALREAEPRCVWTHGFTEVALEIWCTGEIPRPPLELAEAANASGPFLPGAGMAARETRFFLDEECRTPDPLADDQALLIRTRHGLVVLCGCAHAGVIQTLAAVLRFAPGEPIRALIGGLHLMNSTEDVWQVVGDAIERCRLAMIAPCHCTGEGARDYLRRRFPSRFVDAGAGSRIDLEAV